MATLTVAGVDDALREIAGSPNATDAEFRKELNLALPRLYAMGMWRDLLFEQVITTSSSTFTLPNDAESIISALVDYDSSSVDFSTPQEVRSQFHDYRITGRDDDGDTLRAYGIVDDGYSPTVEEPIAGRTYKLKLQTATGIGTQVLPRAGTVHVRFSDGSTFSNPDTRVDNTDGGKFDLVVTNGSSTPITTLTTDITSVSEIRVGTTPLSLPVKILFEDSASAATLVAADGLQAANEVTRYRRYRISNDEDKTIAIRCLLKRKFRPFTSPDDIVYLSSLSAIKHALLGNIAEENADLERANYHWGVCRALLDEQLDASRGAAKPVVKFDPSGVGQFSSNMM